MSTYERRIPGEHDLATINGMIEGEEVGARQFMSNRVKGPDNFATFSKLPAGTIPEITTIVKKGDAPPPERKQVWPKEGEIGKMIVEGKEKEVIAYRKA